MQLLSNPLSLAATILLASTALAAAPLQVQVRAAGGMGFRVARNP